MKKSTEKKVQESEKLNNTEALLKGSLAQGFFEMQVELMSHKPAIICGEVSLTYRELDNKANQLSMHLISMGLVAGDLVGIFLERSVEMVIAVLGVLKSGCCYLPLDPLFPTERIRYMFEDSGARALITQVSFKNKFERLNSSLIVVIDKESDILNMYVPERPPLLLSDQALAYIIYTSGSTGRPKGVKVHHKAVVNFLNSMNKKPGFTNADRLLAVSSLSFDISVLELFLPLSSGGELIISSADEVFDGQKIAILLAKYDITIMQGAPATWNVLIGSGWEGKKNLKALCGGEALTSNLAGQLLDRVSELWNMYGPTETTVWSTCFQIIEKDARILVGKPIDNTTVYIIDSQNKILPIGCKGEVCIGGMGVSKGYHNRPEITAEKFILFENDQVIYKTGDQGRFLADGNIELFGRIDNQIKVSGIRIEPGEIEFLLSELQGVKESVVKINTFEESDDRLVAFLHITYEFTMTDGGISEILSHQLPTFMIPSFYQKQNVFPRMPNGKIDRKALVFRVMDSTKGKKKPYLLLSETEKRLISIWESVLRIENISKYDNFFTIGGSSLLAIRVVNRMREEIEIVIQFEDLINNQTINQLGEYIDIQK